MNYKMAGALTEARLLDKESIQRTAQRAGVNNQGVIRQWIKQIVDDAIASGQGWLLGDLIERVDQHETTDMYKIGRAAWV